MTYEKTGEGYWWLEGIVGYHSCIVCTELCFRGGDVMRQELIEMIKAQFQNEYFTKVETNAKQS